MRVRANFFFRKAWVVVAAALAISACSGGPGQTGSVEILHWWKQGGEADAMEPKAAVRRAVSATGARCERETRMVFSLSADAARGYTRLA